MNYAYGTEWVSESDMNVSPEKAARIAERAATTQRVEAATADIISEINRLKALIKDKATKPAERKALHIAVADLTAEYNSVAHNAYIAKAA